eukprot:CAMPEP_0170555570 /NCGR_PEP_ID=MMETSP0211-20121228/13468_1 /TAXON_ID=311385 /ORGANISM="Pseudokeronopsis sp., Strain OXSARD2" /LENGTH=82 /DNA_ID=CAMNT_0010865505 /DNA_START=1245 /DNA_END=1490 /DNA_ORIENTATION=+
MKASPNISYKKGDSKINSYQDHYDRNVDDFVMKVRDPTFKNNSNGVKGLFTGSINIEYFDDKNYSTRDENVKRILESSEKVK